MARCRDIAYGKFCLELIVMFFSIWYVLLENEEVLIDEEKILKK